jgi:hypothetical protein
VTRTPLMQTAVVLVATGLDLQPGDPWGVATTIAEALGLIDVPDHPGRDRDPVSGRLRRSHLQAPQVTARRSVGARIANCGRWHAAGCTCWRDGDT